MKKRQVRLCTSAYVAPAEDDCDLEDACAHLTNYAINKKSAGWEDPAECGGADADSVPAQEKTKVENQNTEVMQND